MKKQHDVTMTRDADGSLWISRNRVATASRVEIVSVERDVRANYGRGRSRITIEFDNEWEGPAFAFVDLRETVAPLKDTDLSRPEEK